ncbi:MAG: hypothetical protein ACWA6Y_08525 [Polaromonas sp.]
MWANASKAALAAGAALSPSADRPPRRSRTAQTARRPHHRLKVTCVFSMSFNVFDIKSLINSPTIVLLVTFDYTIKGGNGIFFVLHGAFALASSGCPAV